MYKNGKAREVGERVDHVNVSCYTKNKRMLRLPLDGFVIIHE
jgi:hypothetical protein